MSGRAELFRALGALAEPPEPRHAAIAAALGIDGHPAPGDYAEVFLFGAYPYASVYLGAEGMLGGEARDRIAGFWRAVGLTPPPEPDHLAALLGLYAGLIDSEDLASRGRDPARTAMRRQSRKALLWEHLLSWSWPWLDKVIELAPPYHRDWARLLREALAAEAGHLGQADALPLHLRAAPGLPGVDAAAGEWVGAILAPVRSGVVITRPDLRRGAATLGLGARVGERAFTLRSMLEQDSSGTIDWLAAEAAEAAERHRRSEALLGDLAVFWRSRADATAAVLRATLTGGDGPSAGARGRPPGSSAETARIGRPGANIPAG